MFFRILLPLIGPALATFAVFAFMATWNSFLWPLVITQASDRHVTLPVGLSRLQRPVQTDWNVVMAGSVMTLVPIVVFYLITQRWVIRSVAFSRAQGLTADRRPIQQPPTNHHTTTQRKQS